MKKHLIVDIESDSIGEELGIEPGSLLLRINGAEICDVLDYKFQCDMDEILLEIETPDGEIVEAEVEKDPDEDLGLHFTTGLMDQKKVCRNRCPFCFVEQLPSYARTSLRFKDDDWRLSFLSGNYVTLTNVTDEELHRIVQQRISPLYISVHATDPVLRQKLLHNEKGGELLRQMQILCDGGIEFHTQIVLCPGLNDGEILRETLETLFSMWPHARSCAIVPVGLTGHRERLYPLTPVDAQGAKECIALVEELTQKHIAVCGHPFAYCSDEFYVLSGQQIPSYEHYGAFEQLEDGVGMIRLFRQEFESALPQAKPRAPYTCTVATGYSAYECIREASEQLAAACGIEIRVVPVPNRFFDGGVTVSGLLTGSDFVQGLKDKPLGEVVFIPAVTLRQDGVFLDDTDTDWLAEQLGVPVVPVECDGESFVQTILQWKEETI